MSDPIPLFIIAGADRVLETSLTLVHPAGVLLVDGNKEHALSCAGAMGLLRYFPVENKYGCMLCGTGPHGDFRLWWLVDDLIEPKVFSYRKISWCLSQKLVSVVNSATFLGPILNAVRADFLDEHPDAEESPEAIMNVLKQFVLNPAQGFPVEACDDILEPDEVGCPVRVALRLGFRDGSHLRLNAEGAYQPVDMDITLPVYEADGTFQGRYRRVTTMEENVHWA